MTRLCRSGAFLLAAARVPLSCSLGLGQGPTNERLVISQGREREAALAEDIEACRARDRDLALPGCRGISQGFGWGIGAAVSRVCRLSDSPQALFGWSPL